MAELAQDALEPPNRDGDVDESTLIAVPHLAQRVSGRGEEVHHDDVWGEPAIEQGSHEIRGDLVARGADGVEELTERPLLDVTSGGGIGRARDRAADAMRHEEPRDDLTLDGTVERGRVMWTAVLRSRPLSLVLLHVHLEEQPLHSGRKARTNTSTEFETTSDGSLDLSTIIYVTCIDHC